MARLAPFVFRLELNRTAGPKASMRRGLCRPGHIGRQPALEALFELVERQRSRTLDGKNAPAGRPEPSQPHAGGLRPPRDCIGILRGDDIARLILAEPEGVGRRCLAGDSRTAPMPEAMAISASATRRPPSETSCTAVTSPSAMRPRTKSPCAAFGGKVDRRRRALLAAADLAQIKRLAEPACAFRRRAGSLRPRP